VTGGIGADRFLFKGAGAVGTDDILDFSQSDGDTIVFEKTSVTAFSQLSISNNGTDTTIVGGSQTIILHDFVAPLTTADFQFV
jgi:Ca2+-binding RTX toxin-like protein